MTLIEVAQLGTAISAVIALLTFTFTSWKTSQDKAKERLEAWRVAMLQDLFSRYPSLSFDDLHQQYRVEALSAEPVRIKKNDISALALRRALVELLDKKIIWCSAPDHYELNIVPRAEPQDETNYPKQMIRAMLEVDRILATDSFRYDVRDLAVKVSQAANVEYAMVQNVISIGLSQRKIVEDSNGKLGLYINLPRKPKPA